MVFDLKKKSFLGKIKQFSHRRNRYFNEAKVEIASRNIKTMKLACFFGFILLAFLGFLSPLILEGWRVTFGYVLLLVADLVFFVLSHILGSQKELNCVKIRTLCLLFYCVFLTLIIIRGIVSYPDEPDTFLVIGLVLMSFMFTLRPLLVTAISLFFSVVFILLCIQFKAPECVSHDIYHTIIGFAIARMISDVMFSFKIRDYFFSKKLLKSSQEDSLTGVLNKAGCESSCTEFFDSKATSDPYTLFVIDVDNFKSINDSFGHQCGDKLLTIVGNSLLKVFRSSDVVGRIGGDEFCVLMKNTSNIDTVIVKAEAINRVVGEETRSEIKIPITCSIGIAVGQNNDKEFKEVFSIADKSLYRAKSEGKNNYIIDLIE